MDLAKILIENLKKFVISQISLNRGSLYRGSTVALRPMQLHTAAKASRVARIHQWPVCLTLEDQPVESAPISNPKSSEQLTVVYTSTIHRQSFRRQSLHSTFDSAVSEEAGLLQWFIMDA